MVGMDEHELIVLTEELDGKWRRAACTCGTEMVSPSRALPNESAVAWHGAHVRYVEWFYCMAER